MKSFKYCPLCANLLRKEYKNLLICTKCDFHFYNNPVPCNAVIIENNKGEILLVKRKFEPQKGNWDLPGGFIQPDEDLIHSIKREIKEELNTDISIKRIIGIYNDQYIYNNVLYKTLIIVVSGRVTSREIKASDDISKATFFPKDKVLEQRIAFSAIKKALSDYLRK